MRIRIAFGATLALAAAFAFVFLQFRAEAMTQQLEEIAQPVEAIAQQAPPKDPLPAPAEPYGGNSQFSDSVEKVPKADVFGDDAEPSEPSQPIPVNDAELRKADDGGFDPFGNAEQETVRARNVPGTVSSRSNASVFARKGGPQSATEQIRIIRLQNVRAVDVARIVSSLFGSIGSSKERESPQWSLNTEGTSNSLVLKSSKGMFEQVTELAEILDRLAANGADVGKKTQSWPIPHVVNDGPDGGEETDSSQWPIRLVRLQFVSANDFFQIAWDLVLNQNTSSKLRIESVPETNSVVMRGPMAEINQVEKLAQQLDQSAGADAASADAELPFASSPASSSGVFGLDVKWETLPPTGDQARQLRELVARIDERSVALAREIQFLQKQSSNQHPKLKSARQDLLTLLEEAFEKRLQLQGIEVALLNSRLREIESRVHQRAQLRRQIIDRRLRDLLGEKDDLSWEVVRTGPVLPSGSPGDVFPLPESSDDQKPAGFVDVVKNRPDSDDEFALPIPETVESAKVPIEIDSRHPQTVTSIDDELETGPIAQPATNNVLGGVDRVMPVELPENSQSQKDLTYPSRNGRGTWQQELIIAENTVDTAGVKVDQVKNRLSKIKNPDQAEDLKYELQLAELALDQARKLLDQKHRWIGAQRKSLEVNIRYLEKSVALARSEYELMIETLKKAPGTVPVAEVRRQELEIQKAELRLEQAESDLDLFEVENRTSRTSGATRPSPGVPAAKNKPAVAESRLNSGIGASTKSNDKGTPIEPKITPPKDNVPTPSLEAGTPVGKPSSPDEPLPGPSR